jgi:hypothetical protein
MSEQSDVEKAKAVIWALEAKRETCIQRGRELADERASVALAAHTGDQKAAKKLESIHQAIVVHGSELASLDAALRAAGEKLQAAERVVEAIGADIFAADDDLEMEDTLDYDRPQHALGGRAALAQGGQQFDQPDDDEPSHLWPDDGEDDDDACEDGRSPEYKRLKKVARGMVERGQAVSIGKAIEKLYLRNDPLAVAHAKQHRARAAGY